MKKFLTLAILTFLVALSASAAWAQVDPRDSIIIETKQVDSSLNGAGVVLLNVYITNKDSLSALTLALREATLNGTAYILLNTPRNFTGTITPLTAGLQYFPIANFAHYNNSSPDTALWSAFFDATNRDATIEPPHAARTAVWEIKFNHTPCCDSVGDVKFDSSRLVNQSCYFTNEVPTDVKVNFVPGLVTVVKTDVRDVTPGDQRPQAYALSQNYPNPFNANTQISFALPKAGKTTLEIFNVLGQRVSTLVDQYMTAGNKIVNWDGRDNSGRNVPSGVYFYRLRSEDFLQTKKMLMIK